MKISSTIFSKSVKTLVAAMVVCGCLSSASAVADEPAAKAETVQVWIAGLQTAAGPVYVALYDTQAGFDKMEYVQATTARISMDKASAAFEVPQGTYALRMFQDLNGDQKLNFNENGVPTEPVAFSNNASMDQGPAGWDAASFTVEGSAEQTIMLQSF